MPEPYNLSSLKTAWLDFVESAYPLFVPDLNDAPLYQYVQFRDNVFAIIKDDDFLNGLDQTWTPPSNKSPGDNESPAEKIPHDKIQKIRELLVLELWAFSNGMHAEPAPVDKSENKKWFRRWLGRAGSVAGSMKELPEKLRLPWYVESGLIAFKELVEVFEHN